MINFKKVPDITSCFEAKNNIKKFFLEKLVPSQTYCIKNFFTALSPGKYTLKATLTYTEGEPIILETSTLVEPKIETELNIGCVMIGYTLMRLSLNFRLE